MKITAAMVKQLRDRTGSGMMECKKALVDAGGDLEVAVAEMRKAGLAKADKKSGRIAAEGCVLIKVNDDATRGVMVEVNSETDFVSKGDDFKGFVQGVVERVMDSEVSHLDELMNLPMGDSGQSIEETRRHLIAKLGEKITVRRFDLFCAREDSVASYIHGARIGVLVEMTGGDEELGKDVAMHIAASRPVCVDETTVPAETLEKEKEIFVAQAQKSGKPDNIIEKMVSGRLRKFLEEITLVGQPFVKETDKTVGQLLKEKGARVVRFSRFEVGEGIEKKKENFADEVMAQVRGS